MNRKATNGNTTLAQALAQIATAEGSLTTKADHVLAIVKRSDIGDLKAFSAAVREAYAANGWQARSGRPEKGAVALEKVPPTVKQYVSKVRSAFRLEIDMAKFETFSQLRSALAKAQERAKPKAPEDPRLEGISATRAGELNGAPFHDLVAVYKSLPASKQNALVAIVQRIVRQFDPGVSHLHLVAKAA